MSISFPEDIVKGIFSNPTDKSRYYKAKLQRIKIKSEELFQIAFYTK